MPKKKWSAKEDLPPQFEGPMTQKEIDIVKEWNRKKREQREKEADDARLAERLHDEVVRLEVVRADVNLHAEIESAGGVQSIHVSIHEKEIG